MSVWAGILLGLFIGGLSGLLGIGGGVLLVPALVYLAGFSQQQAVGTTLAVLVPPIGIFAALQYYRQGFVDVPTALWIALGFAAGSWLIAGQIKRVPTEWLVRLFGGLLLFLGLRMVVWSDRRAAVMGDAFATWLIEVATWAVLTALAFAAMVLLRRKGTEHSVRPRFADAVKRIDENSHGTDFQI